MNKPINNPTNLIKLTSSDRMLDLYVNVQEIAFFKASSFNQDGYSTEIQLTNSYFLFVSETPEELARLLNRI